MNGSRIPGRRSMLRRTMVSAIAVVATGASLWNASQALAAIIHVNCGGVNLQTRIDSASPGSTLLIKGTCLGTFTVDKDLTLEGDPTATLDGDGAGSTLTIPNVHTVHLISLTITGGLAPQGAGINRPSGGTLTLSRVTVQFNLASGTTAAQGGGIFAEFGPVVVTKSTVTGNRAVALASGATALGGGLDVRFGPLTLSGSEVSSNRAVGVGISLSEAAGGGIFLDGARLRVTASHIDDNRATSISQSSFHALGGGVAVSSSPEVSIEGSTISGNIAMAATTVGSGDALATGGGADLAADAASVAGSTFAGNQALARTDSGTSQVTGGGIHSSGGTRFTLVGTRIVGSRISAVGSTATAFGGGLINAGPLTVRDSRITGSVVSADAGSGTATANTGGLSEDGAMSLIRSTVAGNHVTAISGGNTATAGPAGVNGGSGITMLASTISRNRADARTEASGTAQVFGVGIQFFGSNPSSIKNSTIAGNVGRSEADESTGHAAGSGGGIRTGADSLTLVDTTVARNVLGGVGSVTTLTGGGLDVEAGSTTLKDSILALDTAQIAHGPNCSGAVASQGNNVLGTVAGCTFAELATDKLNRNPKLGPLANNGGPTLTLALLSGSPALNIDPTPCPLGTDQRGVHRPQGPKCDAGSFEKGA